MLEFISKIYLWDKTSVATFLLIIFLLGILFGILAVGQLEVSSRQNLFTTITGFMQGFSGLDYDRTVLMNEMTGIYYSSLLLLWILGISVLGIPLIFILIFIQGFAFGFTIAFMIMYFDLQGFFLIMFAILPQNLISIPVYLLAAVTASTFGWRIINFIRGQASLSPAIFLDYTLKMVLLAFFLFFSILIEVFVSPFVFERILLYI